MRKIGLSTLTILFASSTIFTSLWAQDNRFYLLADIGNSANTDYSFTDADVNSPLISNDINYTSYRLGAGYSAMISQHISLGAEAAYNFYGDEQYNFYNSDQMEVKFSANDVLLVTGYHFESPWEIHLKTGAAYEEVDVTENFVGANLSERQWVPEAAIGTSYNINKHFSVHADFAYLMGWESGVTNMPDITVGWLGINYAF